MTIRFPRRLLALASLALLSPLATTLPAHAATSDAAMLQSYAGSYTGMGTVADTPPQTVRCRLSMQATGPRLIYSGRCSAGGIGFSMTGVITANNGRFQAAMSGSGGGAVGSMSGTVNGTRRGNGVVFSSRQHDTSMGHDRSVSSSFALSGGTVLINFSMVDNKTGKTYAGSIPFTKVSR